MRTSQEAPLSTRPRLSEAAPYLRRGPTPEGRAALTGRRLFDRPREAQSGRCSDGGCGRGNKTRDRVPEEFADDVIKHEALQAFDPTVIYFEGGLIGADGSWRVTSEDLESVVRKGGIAIIADAGRNAFSELRPQYEAAAVSSARLPGTAARTATTSSTSRITRTTPARPQQLRRAHNGRVRTGAATSPGLASASLRRGWGVSQSRTQ